MRRFLDRQRRPLVLGHRGASHSCPENTLAAFRKALEEGADGVELDVMRCGSGEVVVVHDDDLSRVSGRAAGSDRPVRKTSLSELRRFDLGDGERVPTLMEVLEALPGALVNVELKSQEVTGLRGHLGLLGDDGLAQATAAVLRRAGRMAASGTGGATLVSSFDPMQLLRFRRCAGEAVPLGYLFHEQLAYPLRQAWPAGLLRTAAVHPAAALTDAVSIRRWQKAGYAVHVWTVDDENEVAALCGLGVDAIITNYPGRTRVLVEAAAPTSSPAPSLSPSPDSRPSASSRPA